MGQYSKKNSIIYNQEQINRAIKDGHLNFLPIHKFPGKSIGEHIQIKYNQLYGPEFDRYYRNGWLKDYDHIINPSLKITKKDSLLFIRELILKTKEEKNMKQIEKILTMEQCEKDLIRIVLEQEQKLLKKMHIQRRLKKCLKNMK